MSTRTLLRLSLLAGLAAPLCAFALGVGSLEVRSALNQNFEAEIPLIVNNPVELTGLTVRIPRQQDFDQAGIERLSVLSKLRFSVQTPPGGPNVIKISSVEPIREPNFNLLLELVWSRGRLIREFTVQVDPELYANRRQPPPPPPPVVVPPLAAAPPSAAAAPAAPALPPAPPVNFEGASLYGPVRPGETLTAIANRVRPSTAISLPQMMSILLAGNPGSFANGNPNALRSGAMLKVPTAQALGVPGAPTPPTVPPDLAAAPPSPPEPVVTPPVGPPSTEPPAAPPPAVSPPVTAVGPDASATPPLASTPPILSPTEQPQEIVPQASIPQPETPPAPAATVAPPTPPPVAQPQPEPAAPAPAAKPPVQPVVEAEASWMSNPVVWIAIALILLAIASVVLLPLLRRPTRPKPVAKAVGSAAEPAPESAVASEPAAEPAAAATTQTQVREASLTRPLLAAAGSSAAAAAGVGAGAAAAATPQPKSVTELLRDIDFGLGEDRPPPVFGGKGPTPTLELEARLPDAEPATASATRKPSGPSATEEPPTVPEPKKAPTPQAELPSELRLDGFDFDFGDLGLQKPTPPPAELPPLEMKPAAPPGPRFAGLPSVIDNPEPATEPASIASISSILSAQAPAAEAAAAAPTAAEQKFEFTNVAQEYEPQSPRDTLKLDEELRNFGGETLDLGKRGAESPGGLGGRNAAADYVETKLDLATAYLDMGDQMGARGLLEEVLQEGDDPQKQRAEELLKKLG